MQTGSRKNNKTLKRGCHWYQQSAPATACHGLFCSSLVWSQRFEYLFRPPSASLSPFPAPIFFSCLRLRLSLLAWLCRSSRNGYGSGMCAARLSRERCEVSRTRAGAWAVARAGRKKPWIEKFQKQSVQHSQSRAMATTTATMMRLKRNFH